MSSPAAGYPAWKAPARDGQILLWPGATQILNDTVCNHKQLSGEAARIQNVPLHEVRRRMRQDAAIDDDALVVADGHQTELYHAGVWAKIALAAVAAVRLRGRALHLAVDTDQPKHLALRWPGQAVPITDDPNLSSAAWSGMLHAPTPAQLKKLRADLSGAGFTFEPAAGRFLDSLQEQSIRLPPLSQAITTAMAAVDESVGLKSSMLLVSPLWNSQPYLVLVHHFLARAGQLAGQYNAALATYRRAHKIRSAMRPMPDLAGGVAGADPECEVPFWLDDLVNGVRRRAMVKRMDGRWAIFAEGGDAFSFDESADGWDAAGRLQTFLARSGLRISPRAVTTTVCFRLLLADQFIHGIGGGRYDQVSDSLMSGLFNFTPPRFAVTTATLYFPTATGRERVDLPAIAHRGHQIKHSLLGEAKMQMVRELADLPRQSTQRAALFMQMRAELAGAARDHPAIQQWEEQSALAQARHMAEQKLFDRELFYALQPKERLQLLLGQYQAQFAQAT